MKTQIAALSLAVSLAIASTASRAASIEVSTDNSGVVGGNVTLFISGRQFATADATFGGDFRISFPTAYLQYVSHVVANPPFDTSSVTTTNAGSGVVDFDVASFSAPATGLTGTFDIASITFKVLQDVTGGVTVRPEARPSGLGWFKIDGLTPISLSYNAGTVNAVPAPAAVWLLLSGVGALAGRRALRKAA